MPKAILRLFSITHLSRHTDSASSCLASSNPALVRSLSVKDKRLDSMNGVISEERASPVESRGHSRLRRRKAPTKVRAQSLRPDSDTCLQKAAVETTSSCSHAHTRGVRRRQPWLQSVAYAPSFTPTEEEFRDPVAFIRRIEPEGAKYGICKITVPPEFRTRVDQLPEMLRSFTFTAREQKLREHVWDNFGKTEIIYEHAQ